MHSGQPHQFPAQARSDGPKVPAIASLYCSRRRGPLAAVSGMVDDSRAKVIRYRNASPVPNRAFYVQVWDADGSNSVADWRLRRSRLTQVSPARFRDQAARGRRTARYVSRCATHHLKSRSYTGTAQRRPALSQTVVGAAESGLDA